MSGADATESEHSVVTPASLWHFSCETNVLSQVVGSPGTQSRDPLVNSDAPLPICTECLFSWCCWERRPGLANSVTSRFERQRADGRCDSLTRNLILDKEGRHRHAERIGNPE